MKKLFLLSLFLMLLIGCTPKKESSSNINSSNINSYNDSKVTLSNNEVTVFVGGIYQISVESEYHYTYYIQDSSLIKIERRNGVDTIYGLKEGTTMIMALSLNGRFADCVVNVINKDSIKTLEDIYAIEETGKLSKNFTPLYVVENNNGIVKYIYNIYQNNLTKPIPYFVTCNINFINEEVDSSNSSDYEIISFNRTISPLELKYGDIIICHHDYKFFHHTLLPIFYTYNLFYVGETNQTFDFYYDLPAN